MEKNGACEADSSKRWQVEARRRCLNSLELSGKRRKDMKYQYLEIIFQQACRFLLTECSFTFKLEHSIDILPQFT
ncbi:hypothetical protein BHE17_12860 [Planococcus maritimus]|nr:hypothetical protein BHE17_12860 [Planococcus maritimus]